MPQSSQPASAATALRREKHQPSPCSQQDSSFPCCIAAQGAHAGAFIALERHGELVADGGIARSGKIDKENGAVECGREEIGAFASDVRHGSRPSRGGERKEQLAFGLEGGEPGGERMRGAGADDNHVGGLEGAACAVGVDHGDLRPGCECSARTGCKAFVDFDGGDFAGGPVSSARMAV